MIFGNGQTTDTDIRAKIGDLDAIVCKDSDLTEDLISLNPLLDMGFQLTMESKEGTLYNPATDATIHVRRTGPRWSVDLEDLARAAQKIPSLVENQSVHDMTSALAVITKEPKSIRERVIALHERMGHPNAEAMCAAVGGEDPTWTHCDLRPDQIRRVMRDMPCLICLLAKRPKPSVGKASGDREDMPPGHCLSADIVPIAPPAHDGSIYAFIFADVSTGYEMIFTGKAKPSFLQALQTAVQELKKHGRAVKILRTDSETILKNGDVGNFLADNGITPELSTPYAHYQNLVERHVDMVTRGTAAMLHGQPFLRARHWDWAMYHSVACRNRTPNTKCHPLSPHEVMTGRKVNLEKTFQFTFGDLVAVHVPKEKRSWKFDLRWDIGIYIGQPEESVDAALLFFPYTNQVLIRTDIVKLDISDDAYRKYYARKHEVRDDSESTSTRISRITEPGTMDITSMIDTVANDATQDQPLTAPMIEPEEVPPELADPPQREGRTKFKPSRPITRSQTISHAMPAQAIRREIEKAVTEAIRVMLARASGPKVDEALLSPIRDMWVDAMYKEVIDSMLNTTKSLCPEDIDESKPYRVIHATMQLKIKMKTAEIIDKLKARLCACGNELDEVDSETYSPTVSALTHSTLLQLAVHDRMHLQTIDTVAAYLCQDYPEDATPLYIILPKRVAQVLNLNPKQTYRVKKYIYGLPDAGRAYYDAYCGHLIDNGYTRTAADPCLFFKWTSSTTKVFVWIHVDDTMIAATSLRDIDDFKDMMRKRFEITVNEQADQHLGVNIKRLSNGAIKLTQSKLLASIFKEFPVEDSKSRTRQRVPLRPIASKLIDDTPSDRRQYLHLLGMLNYLLRSRPDISTALSFAATRAVNPTVADFDRLLDVVKYLWTTKDLGLVLHPGNPDQPLKLTCYVDASYLTHDDSKGHTGYCLSFGISGSFFSKSIKQSLVTTSSTHAEVKALYQLVVDIVFVINLCDEIGRPISLPAVVFEDNSPTVQLAGDISARVKKSKHFVMLVDFIRQHVVMGLLEVKKIASDENIADVLTKALDWKQFAPKAAKLLGMIDIDSLEDE